MSRNAPSARQRSLLRLLPVVATLVVLFVMASGPAAWAATTATVPRETPTRRATATPVPPLTATPLPPPTAEPQATETAAPPATPSPLASETAAAPATTPTAGVVTSPVPATPIAPLATASETAPAASPTIAARTPSAVQSPVRATPPAPPVTAPPPTVAGAATRPAPPDGVCNDAIAAPLELRAPAGDAVLEAPPGSLVAPVCLYLDDAGSTKLPPAPDGYRISGPVVRLRATDRAGNALPSFTFAQPVTLSLRIPTHSLGAGLSAGFLGETSSDWALMETVADQAAGTAHVSTRLTGVYALLVETPPAAEGSAGWRAGAAVWAPPVAGVAAALLLLVVLLWLKRRRG